VGENFIKNLLNPIKKTFTLHKRQKNEKCTLLVRPPRNNFKSFCTIYPESFDDGKAGNVKNARGTTNLVYTGAFTFAP
jgi:hypothetical protein